MERSVIVVGALALVSAAVGYFSWLHRRTRVDFAFVPGIAFSAATVVVFLAGILNLLPLAVVTIVVAGVVLLALEWRTHRRELKAVVQEPALWVLAAVSAYMAWYVRGQRFVHYDNFSHWALVVRVMLDENRFPTFEDPVVVFQSYPLGSASFIYLITRVLSSSESCMMLAQGVLTLGFVLALMGISRRHRIVSVVLTVGTFAALLAYNIPLDSLLVDSLLAAMGGYLLLFVVVHRARLGELLVPFGAVMCALTVVKNSGLFFVLIATVVAAMVVRQAGGRLGWRFWAAVASPFAITLVWNRHVALVFDQGLEAKHSMSPGHLASVFKDKSPSDVASIVRHYAEVSLHDRTGAVLLLALVAVTALLTHRKVLALRTSCTMLAGVLLTVALYHAGTLAMYLFSMPLGEALALAGYVRYLRVLHLALLMVLLALAVTALHTERAVPARVLTTAGAVAVVTLLIVIGKGTALLPPTQNSEVRTAVEEAVGSSDVPSDERVCVLLDKDDKGYRRYLVRYTLLSQNVVNKILGPKTDAKAVADCQHFVLLNNDPAATALLRSQGLRAGHAAPILVNR
jgi:hypothetical protein